MARVRRGPFASAALALSLWLVLRFGSHPTREISRVSAPKYAMTAVGAMALGYPLYWVGGGSAALWVAGFVAVGMGTIALSGPGGAGPRHA